VTEGRDGDWVVVRVCQFASFDTDERIVVCYCQYEPINAQWQELRRGAPVDLSSELNNLAEIRQEVTKIASGYGVFQCVECSQAIKEFLIARNISGKQIKLDLGRQDLPWSVIYDLRREQQIANNGYHEGIVIVIDGQEIVFDNIDYSGVIREERKVRSPL
jgi:hypothetical protein